MALHSGDSNPLNRMFSGAVGGAGDCRAPGTGGPVATNQLFGFHTTHKHVLGPWRTQSSQCPHNGHSGSRGPSSAAKLSIWQPSPDRPLSLSPALALPMCLPSAQLRLYPPICCPEPSGGAGTELLSGSLLSLCPSQLPWETELTSPPPPPKYTQPPSCSPPRWARKTQVDNPTDGPGFRHPLRSVSQMWLPDRAQPTLTKCQPPGWSGI